MARAFANLDGLMRLSQREGVDIRPSLLRVLTDLYVQNRAHTRDEEQQFVELALRLLPNVDAASRTAVAIKLAAYPNAPNALLKQLAAEIASLRSAPPVPIEQAPSPRMYQHSRIFEQRPLAPAPYRPVRNESAAGLGERFIRATSHERRELLRSLSTDESTHNPATTAKETLHKLERAALELRPRDFAGELQAALGVSHRLATQIAQDDDGESVLVAARALGMHVDQLLRILLFLNPAIGQSVDRVFSLYRLYEEISPAAAAKIVHSWCEAGTTRVGAHQPLLAPDSTNRESTLLSRRSPEGSATTPQKSEAERARG